MISRPRRHLHAELLATAPAAPASDGLWLIYTGAVVQTCVDGIEEDADGVPALIDLVIDCASLQLAAPELPALADHHLPVGKWSDIAIDPAAATITARLALLTADAAQSQGLPMFDAARELRLAVAQMPWQASVGGKPGPAGRYERLTGPALINGREIMPGARPLYVLRGGVLDEASIVIFGADGATRRIAARAATNVPHPKERTVSTPTSKQRLDLLTAKLGANRRGQIATLMAEEMTDEQITSTVGEEAGKEKDAALAKLKAEYDAKCAAHTALEAENASLKQQLAALAPPADGKAATGTPAAGGAVAASAQPNGAAQPGAQPKTMLEAQALLRRADPKLSGMALFSAARRAYPHLVPKPGKPAA